MPPARINEIVREKRGITPDTALRLARFWAEALGYVQQQPPPGFASWDAAVLPALTGHLILLVFTLGGEYLLKDYGGFIGITAGTVSILGSIVLTFFEGFVQLLQAYVFTLLTALYIGGALADEH